MHTDVAEPPGVQVVAPDDTLILGLHQTINSVVSGHPSKFAGCRSVVIRGGVTAALASKSRKWPLACSDLALLSRVGKPPASIPPLIVNYQAAHDRHDISAALATFAEDAVVRDEDETWAGTDQIRQWLAKTSSEYTYTRTLLGAEPTGTASWLVRNRLEGNFPGNVVDLRYEFTLDGDRISALTIAP